MNCDNCGAEIDKDEEYCPNCGMQLFDLPPNPLKKKSYKSSESISRGNSVSYEKSNPLQKPIKQRYVEHSKPESPDYSHYEQEYEHPDNYEEEIPKVEHKESSGSGMASIILFLFIALILGFIVGLLIFGSQSVLPGF